jgi:hypothetical protein
VNRRRWAIAAAGILLGGALLAAEWPEARAQEAAQTSLQPAADRSGLERPAAARPAKERMAVYVILTWVWLLIFVLLGFLRMRAREADRVHRMGFLGPDKEDPKGPGH